MKSNYKSQFFINYYKYFTYHVKTQYMYVCIHMYIYYTLFVEKLIHTHMHISVIATKITIFHLSQKNKFSMPI